jgi:hypothetical protein
MIKLKEMSANKPLSTKLQAELTAAVWLDGRVEQEMAANAAKAVDELMAKLGVKVEARGVGLEQLEKLPVPLQILQRPETTAEYTDFCDTNSCDCETWDQSCISTFDNCQTNIACDTLSCDSVVYVC